MEFLKPLLCAVLILGLLAFVGFQIVGIVNDVKKKNALKKEVEKIESDKKD